METVTLLELIWTMPALLWAWRYLWRYRHAAEARHGTTGGRRQMQDIRCLRALTVVVAEAAWGGVGIYAMTQPPAPSSATTASPAGLLVLALLMLGPNALGLMGEWLDVLEGRLPPPSRLSGPQGGASPPGRAV